MTLFVDNVLNDAMFCLTTAVKLSMEDSEAIQVGQITVRYFVDGSSIGGSGVFELSIPPGAQVPPPHSHNNNDERVYVLEGVLRYQVGDETRDLSPGHTMFSPRGKVHAFSNPGPTLTRALVTQHPDLGPQYFRDVAQLHAIGDPPNPGLISRLMAEYGVIPLGKH